MGKLTQLPPREAAPIDPTIKDGLQKAIGGNYPIVAVVLSPKGEWEFYYSVVGVSAFEVVGVLDAFKLKVLGDAFD